MSATASLQRLAPGILLCVAITALALALQWIEERVFAHPYVEALVLAILIGTAIRTVWNPGPSWREGIGFSAKQLLEFAVMMLGASLSIGVILAAGPALLTAIAATVAIMLAVGYALGRALRLPHRMAILIACGNAICGNSAIAAVAPVIGAKSDEVAASVAFTAILGVVVVLALPFLIPLMALTQTQYGVVAGLTVYAVPQVLAAAVPVGPIATQVGTLVKLVRVLMLGPVVILMALVAGTREGTAKRPGIGRLVPWFIVGFLVLAGLRSLSLIPEVVTAPILYLSRFLTIISMAALGLGVDVRVVGQVGPAVIATVSLSLALLVAISLALVRVLGIV